MTEVLRTAADFRAACVAARHNGTLALVPTMGALHAGHMSLVTEAARRATTVCVSIFVNPTQFGPSEDLESYPRDLSSDVAKCSAAGVAYVFAPDAAQMYPTGETTRVRVDGLTEALCGQSRPGHFEGVATIVAKFFNLAGECTAVFGRKDYQQLKVIERMARDLLLPVQVVGAPTVREKDGLALSSRNAYLDAAQRRQAAAIPDALREAAEMAAGDATVSAVRAAVVNRLSSAGLEPDYVTVADPETIAPLDESAALPARALLALAAFVGTTRLIDNMVLGEDPPPRYEIA